MRNKKHITPIRTRTQEKRITRITRRRNQRNHTFTPLIHMHPTRNSLRHKHIRRFKKHIPPIFRNRTRRPTRRRVESQCERNTHHRPERPPHTKHTQSDPTQHHNDKAQNTLQELPDQHNYSGTSVPAHGCCQTQSTAEPSRTPRTGHRWSYTTPFQQTNPRCLYRRMNTPSSTLYQLLPWPNCAG